MKKTAQFQVEVPAHQVYPAMLAGLPSLGYTIDAADPATGRIWANSAFSMRTYGSKLEVDVLACGPASTTVDVRSASKYPLQATDWGKTKADLAKIERLAHTGRLDP